MPPGPVASATESRSGPGSSAREQGTRVPPLTAMNSAVKHNARNVGAPGPGSMIFIASRPGPESPNPWRNRDGWPRISLWSMANRNSWIAQRQSCRLPGDDAAAVAARFHDHFEHCPVDRTARSKQYGRRKCDDRRPRPLRDQLFPFVVVRVRSPAKAGANTPSSALADETTYTGYENLGAPATRCSRPASM